MASRMRSMRAWRSCRLAAADGKVGGVPALAYNGLPLGMDLEKWYRKEQGRARVLATHGGPQNPDKPTLVPDPNAISDEEKARLEKMREAAAEARHQLAILQQQIRTMQAEWVKLSATDLEWKMPDVPDGWSEPARRARFVKTIWVMSSAAVRWPVSFVRKPKSGA